MYDLIYVTRKKFKRKKKTIRSQIGYKLRTYFIYICIRTGVSRVNSYNENDGPASLRRRRARYIILYAETITMASLSTQYKGRIKNKTVNNDNNNIYRLRVLYI